MIVSFLQLCRATLKNKELSEYFNNSSLQIDDFGKNDSGLRWKNGSELFSRDDGMPFFGVCQDNQKDRLLENSLNCFDPDSIWINTSLSKVQTLSGVNYYKNIHSCESYGAIFDLPNNSYSNVVLIERKCCLLSIRHCGFLLILNFTFETKQNADPEEVLRFFSKISKDRQLNFNNKDLIGQDRYAQNLVAACRNEIHATLLGDSAKASALPADIMDFNPAHIFPVVFSSDNKTDFTTFLFNRLERPEGDLSLFKHKDSSFFSGWNFAVGNSANKFSKEFLADLIFIQTSYNMVRQMQDFFNARETKDCINLNSATEETFLFYQRFAAQYSLYHTKLPPYRFQNFCRIENLWNMTSASKSLKEIVELQERYTLRKNQDAEANRGKIIQLTLFGIAVLQIFSLGSVVADYFMINKEFNDISLNSSNLFSNDFYFDPDIVKFIIFYKLHILSFAVFSIVLFVYILFITKQSPTSAVQKASRLLGRKSLHSENTFSLLWSNPKGLLLHFLARLKQLKISSSVINGQGLFAARHFEPNSLIFKYNLSRFCTYAEYGSTIPQRNQQWNAVSEDYLGFAARNNLYIFINHANQKGSENARADFDFDSKTISIRALRNIRKSEEIVINYMNEPLPAYYIRDLGYYL